MRAFRQLYTIGKIVQIIFWFIYMFDGFFGVNILCIPIVALRQRSHLSRIID